jgi:hypothetical protein
MSVRRELSADGFASPTFQKRFPYLQSFWTLMDAWPGPKPASWKECPTHPSVTASGDQWERNLVGYYAQTFYDHFGRPPILPRYLPVA